MLQFELGMRDVHSERYRIFDLDWCASLVIHRFPVESGV